MAYTLGGLHGESNSFTARISNFAYAAAHFNQSLMTYTYQPEDGQGTEYKVPTFAPITWQEYNETGTDPIGNAVTQNPNIGTTSVFATPKVATTSYGKFIEDTAAFSLAQMIGMELGQSYMEKIDQEVTSAFLDYKATPDNTYYPVSVDGGLRVLQLGAMELVGGGVNVAGANVVQTPGFTVTSVYDLLTAIKDNWNRAHLVGNPMVILDSTGNGGGSLPGITGGSTQRRLAKEFTLVTGSNNLTDVGNRYLRMGIKDVETLADCDIMFSPWLQSSARTVANIPGVANGAAGTVSPNVLVGAYFYPSVMGQTSSLTTYFKRRIEVTEGLQPQGLQTWVTGTAFFGCGATDTRRGGAINIQQFN